MLFLCTVLSLMGRAEGSDDILIRFVAEGVEPVGHAVLCGRRRDFRHRACDFRDALSGGIVNW
jgi:hypothetical protein